MFTRTARKVLAGAAVAFALVQMGLLAVSTAEYIQLASRLQ
jgi:hypothetical protein